MLKFENRHVKPHSAYFVCIVMLDDDYLLPKINYHSHCFSLHLTPPTKIFIILWYLYHCISLYHFIKSLI